MCGILGVFGHERAAELVTLGLFAEQHRGQESCGIAVSNGSGFKLRKKMGLVKFVLNADALAKLPGNIAIGHVRYPTRGTSTEYNSQPHVVETLAGPIYSLASNGDIVNYDELRKVLEGKGVHFVSGNDGELLLKYLVYFMEVEKLDWLNAVRLLMRDFKGAYSTVFSFRDEMVVFRDPYAFRPMVYGQTHDGAFIVASESCALDILKPEWKKEMKPAGIIHITKDGIREIDNDPADYRKIGTDQHCIFEHIYFSRPDSFQFGENVYEVRERIGAMLAQGDKDLNADVVIPVPDSANSMALGYAKESGVRYEMGLIRNHYVGRTFIKPQQTVRDESVSQKFNPLPNFFKGKRVVMVDDSIVRGTTIRKIVNLIQSQGAKEVHLRIGSPPVKNSCFYGIDTPTKEELIANLKSTKEIEKYLNVDSLRYITIDELRETVTDPDSYCYACFNGQYPIK